MSYDANAPVLQALRSLRALDLMVFTAVIAAGESLSTAVDLGSNKLLRIDLPADWPDVGFETLVSADGTAFGRLELLCAGLSAKANARILVAADTAASVRFLKFRSVNGAGAPINQAAARSIKLVAG